MSTPLTPALQFTERDPVGRSFHLLDPKSRYGTEVYGVGITEMIHQKVR